MSLRIFIQQLAGLWKRSQGPHPQRGANTYIDPSTQFLGAQQVRIGTRSAIGEDCWFNVNHREGSEAAIEIGDFCFIGRRNFLTSGSKIVLGDYCLTGTDCQFLGANHSYADPLKPYVISEVLPEEPIVIGTNCWLGASVIILRGVKIGHGSIIGAGSVVTRSVPPFSIVIGNPGIVSRRFDFASRQWIAAADWRNEMEAQQPDEAAYRKMLKEKYPRVHVPTIASSGSLGNL
ncbi:MAG: acyltransferase [Chthoniobacterales bacterium]